jgi:hypothetical protein
VRGAHGRDGGRGKMEADLQGMVQSLGGNTNTSDTNGHTAGSTVNTAA